MTAFEKIALIENEVEAGVLGSLLSQQQIPHRIASYYDSAYDGLFQAARGWGHVEAPAEYRAEVEATLEDLRAGPGLPEDGPE